MKKPVSHHRHGLLINILKEVRKMKTFDSYLKELWNSTPAPEKARIEAIVKSLKEINDGCIVTVYDFLPISL